MTIKTPNRLNYAHISVASCELHSHECTPVTLLDIELRLQAGGRMLTHLFKTHLDYHLVKKTVLERPDLPEES